MPRFGRQKHMLPFMKLFAHERLIEPKCSQVVRPLLHEHADNALPESAATSIYFDDFAADRLHSVVVELADLATIREILVISREEKDEVAGCADVQLRQKSSPLRPDGSHEFDRRRQLLSRRRLPACCRLLLSRMQ